MYDVPSPCLYFSHIYHVMNLFSKCIQTAVQSIFFFTLEIILLVIQSNHDVIY